MGVKQWVRAVLVLSALPSSALALGLGDIRLSSPLNAPLDAEIELVNATPEELVSLKVQLASRETFARYGLEWPAFLNSITLTKAKGASGRDVLRVRSSEAITEPFVTLLVDANWGRGRLVREYTLLLDPPVFAPAPAAAAPVQAPATAAARSGNVTRAPTALAESRPAAPVRSEAVSARSATAAAGDGSYSVRRGDTLSGIAREFAAERGATSEQAMVSLFRTNPAAFDGSMNLLRAGAVLRVPDADTMAAIDRNTALAEVRRQRSEWRGRAGTSRVATASADAVGEGRLRLVPPAETGTGASGAEGAAGATQAMRDRVTQLEKELAESRRLLEVRSAQIAQLQQQAGGAAAAPALPDASTAAAIPPADAAGSAPAAGDVRVDSATPVDAAAGVEPSAANEPVVDEPVAPMRPVRNRPAEDASPAVEEPSLLGSLLSSLAQFWWVLVGILALAAGLFGYRRWQQQRATDLDDSFGGTTTTAREMTMASASPATADTSRLRRPSVAASAERSGGFVVEESGEFEQPRGMASAGPVAKSVAADETFSGETGINLDQGDPLAEADFHMAYGLYDQAADLVRLAAAREPERRDLKLKLAEVFFVWGNRDEFLASARELYKRSGESAPGEWDKIVIMGKQIAPEDPLFAGATARGSAVGDGGLDLQLDVGSQPLDFDVFGDGSGSTQTIESVAGSDLEFGPARREDPTVERPGPGGGGRAFNDDTSDDPTVMAEVGGATTREMAPKFGTAPTAELPHLDVDLDDLLGPESNTTVAAGSEAPTVEQPGLRAAAGLAARAKLDAALRHSAPASDQTAELAIDDLGLDLGDLEQLHDLDAANPAESSEHDDVLLQGDDISQDDDHVSPDAPTMLASFDEDAQRLIEKAATSHERAIDPGATAALQTLRIDAPGLNSLQDSGATSRIPALDATQIDSAEFDLSGFEVAGEHELVGNGLDLDIGQSTLPSLEPVTISEVGTKLDLARAYMDMGDPDGARNILREVLSEGSVSQKQEANRLLESLPG